MLHDDLAHHNQIVGDAEGDEPVAVRWIRVDADDQVEEEQFTDERQLYQAIVI